jgi:hypothetical protein
MNLTSRIVSFTVDARIGGDGATRPSAARPNFYLDFNSAFL